MPIVTPQISSTLMARGIYDADNNSVVDTVQGFNWNDLQAKPSVFPPIMPHPVSHTINEITGLSTKLATLVTKDSLPVTLSGPGAVAGSLYYTTLDTDKLLNVKASVIHFHNDLYYQKPYINTVVSPSGIDSSLAVYEQTTPLQHQHDDRYYSKTYVDNVLNSTNFNLVNDARYYTKPEVDQAVATKAPFIHNHDDLYYTKAQVTGFLATLGDGLFVYTPGAPATSWFINHGLGRYPTVNVVVSGELASARIIYPDSDHITVQFYLPQTGQAYLT